ncbi:hypothetical protein D9M71_672340 [compost metagenome]
MRHQHTHREQYERFETVLMRRQRPGSQTCELHLLLARQVVIVTTLLFHGPGHGHSRQINQHRTDKHAPEWNTHQAASLIASGNGASVGV